MANIRDNFVKVAQKYVGTGCKIFNDYFGMPAGTPWCADFVSKCAADVGLINKCFVKVLVAGDIPRYGVAKGYGKWFEGHEAFLIPATLLCSRGTDLDIFRDMTNISATMWV